MTVVWLSLFHYYTAFTGFLAYLFIARRRLHISGADTVFLLGIALLVLAQHAIKDSSAIIFDTRFYWGWVIFYFIFKKNALDEKVFGNVLALLCVITLIEAILINTVIPAYALPNFPAIDASPGDFVPAGMYQRPYSFGANATVGSSLLVVLMAISKVQGWRLWLGAFTVLVFLSGTGIFMLLLLLLVRYPGWAIKLLLLLSTMILGVSNYFPQEVSKLSDIYNNKVGIEYLEFLVNFKSSQLSGHIGELDAYMIFFGGLGEYRGGDFGFLAFFLANGIFGLLLFLMILFRNMNLKNRFPLFLLVLSSFHYPVMFFFPGQMLLGWLLNQKNRAFKS